MSVGYPKKTTGYDSHQSSPWWFGCPERYINAALSLEVERAHTKAQALTISSSAYIIFLHYWKLPLTWFWLWWNNKCWLQYFHEDKCKTELTQLISCSCSRQHGLWVGVGGIHTGLQLCPAFCAGELFLVERGRWRPGLEFNRQIKQRLDFETQEGPEAWGARHTEGTM